LHDARALHALREILIWAADDDAFHLFIARSNGRARSKRIVGFELHHRPHDDSGGNEHIFEQLKLRQQRRIDAFAGFVVVPELLRNDSIT
jgi:hypothetical protein